MINKEFLLKGNEYIVLRMTHNKVRKSLLSPFITYLVHYGYKTTMNH